MIYTQMTCEKSGDFHQSLMYLIKEGWNSMADPDQHRGYAWKSREQQLMQNVMKSSKKKK